MRLTAKAVEALLVGGATYRPVPRGRASPYFSGSEMFVPTALFSDFNALLREGEIRVRS